MAASASDWVGISTKPNPRGSPMLMTLVHFSSIGLGSIPLTKPLQLSPLPSFARIPLVSSKASKLIRQRSQQQIEPGSRVGYLCSCRGPAIIAPAQYVERGQLVVHVGLKNYDFATKQAGRKESAIQCDARPETIG
jgi:hypothetical protein